MPITVILSLITGATQVLTAFKGDAATAKVTDYVQTAVSTIGALFPLVQQWTSGEDVTLEDAREALSRAGVSIAKLEAEIAAKP